MEYKIQEINQIQAWPRSEQYMTTVFLNMLRQIRLRRQLEQSLEHEAIGVIQQLPQSRLSQELGSDYFL
ncbi:MAG: hypothetical protein UT11_C0070G0014 [Berkelbacteria bacterium GW2011_GWA2_38_9]|uniref:Uncharacterized protein n=1 Tax=Berkelbacteria bacterium GW2011_GWA2_38_9 TaxID=1618334 RepID=A0A0G0L3A6_9BACT|nr:MAG: hypothetical protein UT11_C0070G0014 [Berkelbacteria bacterium GW2011_GWA2_38_9]